VAASLVVALVTVCVPAPVHAADEDPWVGTDKSQHFVASAGLALTGYGLARPLSRERVPSLIAGAGLALSAGITKEALDLGGDGSASWKDLAWDAMGAATGLAVMWIVDLLVGVRVGVGGGAGVSR
jgi:putative lipoprotein